LNSEGFRETLSEERQRGPKKAKMAGKKEAKQKAGPRGQTEITEKKLKVPQEQRTPQRRAGREQPKACSEGRRRERRRRRTLRFKGNPRSRV
jgi:hypothetical protein